MRRRLGAAGVRGSSDPHMGGAAKRRSPDNRAAGQRPATTLSATYGGKRVGRPRTQSRTQRSQKSMRVLTPMVRGRFVR